MKRLFSLLLCGAAAFCARAQADTGQRFLWFTGHWSPAKKNTFVATGSSGGANVTVQPDHSIHINSAGIDAWNKRVRQATQSEKAFIRQLEDPADNIDPVNHQFYQLLLPDAEEREQEFQDLTIDANQDVLSADAEPGQAGTPPQPQQPTDTYCRQMKADYDEVIAWWKAHRHDKYDALTYPTPPAFEYNCYACDTSLKRGYEETIDNYVRDFFHPEDDLVSKALAIMKAKQSGGPTAAACSDISMDDLGMAVYDITYHAYERADKMMMENRKNFKAIEAVKRTWLKAVRKLEMISGSTGIESNGMRELAATLSLAIDHYTTELQHNDWRQIGNVPFIVGLMRDEALISGNEGGYQDFLARLQQLWNGFKLTIEMDIKVGKDGGYEIEHLKGEGHIIPAFQQDSSQCYKWVMADENRLDNQGFYMSSGTQAIDCNLLDAEVITPRARPKYVGTKFYRATLKSLSMDFCNPGHDTIMLTNMYPNPTSAGQWEYPGAGILNLGDNNMDAFFQSLADRKRLADNGEAKQAAAQMKQQGEQLAAQMKALQSQMGGPQGAVNYEKMMELKNKVHAMTTSSVAGKLLYVDFLLPVHNNAPVLVDKRFDAKEINPAENAVIVYGYYTIHIENPGNGRSKTTPSK